MTTYIDTVHCLLSPAYCTLIRGSVHGIGWIICSSGSPFIQQRTSLRLRRSSSIFSTSSLRESIRTEILHLDRKKIEKKIGKGQKLEENEILKKFGRNIFDFF